jgi:zinc protease
LLDWLHFTRRSKLQNDLTILTYPLPNSQVAALHFCVKAGYFCETDQEVGLAHLLEHMYFKGSARFPEPGTLGVRMKSLGAQINATTSYDQTNYFCEAPAENLEAALDIMADAMIAPLFPSDELAKECEVVIEEFNRKLDSPASYSQELLIQLAFQVHRMKRWRIGTPQQLRSFTRENLFDYFHRYYQPQNIVITVSGKFDEEKALGRLHDLFSPLQNSRLVKDFGPAEPPQTSFRHALHTGDTTQSYLHVGFHVPGVMHPQLPALDFLISLLSGGRSSRLHRHLVENRRTASVVSSGLLAYEDIGLIVISAVTEARHLREASQDIWAVIKDVKRNGITSSEMLKVKNKLKLHQQMQTEDALNLASLLSYHEAYGGYETIEEYISAMEKLKEEQILEVMDRYFQLQNTTLLEFTNEKIEPLEEAEYQLILTSAPSAPETSMPAPFVKQQESEIGRISEPAPPIIHKGRVTYILLPDRNLAFTAGGIFFKGGRNEENESIAGISQLLFRMALKGTPQVSAEEIAFRFDALGNPPRLQSSRDLSGFLFESLPEYFLEIWDLLIHCLRDSHFPIREIETEKGKIISAIRRNLDDTFVRPLQLFQQAFYGSHPYGLPDGGFEESVLAFTAENLSSWRERLFNADRTIIGIAGNFEPNLLLQELESRLNTLPAGGDSFQPPSEVRRPQKREMVENRPKKQTAFVLGFPAVAAGNPEVFRYEAVQQILSGMGGRLFLNLRSKKSLAYTVYAGTASHLYSGTFLTYIAGEASKEKQALDGMWKELENLKNNPVNDQEMQNSRAALIGNYILNTQTACSRIVEAVNNYLLNRPLPYAPIYTQMVYSIRPEELMEVTQKTFDPDQACLGMIRGSTSSVQAEKLLQQS